ncbi:MAG: serine/threonine-protein kinase [Kofleriaceae bacterium]
MPICPACSNATPEQSGKFCPECGAVLAAAAAATVSSRELVPEASDPAVAATQTGSESKRRIDASLVGTKIDGFSLEGVIGGGAFGTVYRGRQTGLDRPVAIKVPTMEIASDPVMAKRFAREARSAARITHPGVVAIYAVGELADGRPYLAMELLEGMPLDSIIVDGPIPVVRALNVTRSIASALSETHAAGVVHRDLKPTNVMWRRDRHGDDRITIVDFGIAVCKPGNADATRLTAGGLIGTPHYMSPEQAHGEVVDARADIYALGCLLFELVTGTTPFEGSGFEVLLAHLGRPPPRPSDKNRDIPERVDRMILAMMAKKPDERVPTADAVVELIDDALDALASGAPEPPAPRPRAKRKTAGTKHDRPTPRPAMALDDDYAEPASSDSTPMVVDLERPSRARWLALGAVLALVLSAGAFVIVRLVDTSDSRASGIEDREPAAEVQRRLIFRDDGETRLRVWVPEPFVVGRQRLRIELRNKLGAPILAEQLIVTMEDPEHRALGITARPRQDSPEQFGLSYDYKQPGTYILRVFPPEDAARSPSTFDVDLAVSAKP